MRYCAFGILCVLVSGCGDNTNMNDKAYVITKTQVDEMEAEDPTPSLEN